MILLLALLFGLSPLQLAQQTTVVVNGSLTQTDSSQTVTAGGVDYCSGFVVRKDAQTEIVATAKHCVKPTSESDDKGNVTTLVPTPKKVYFEDGLSLPVVKVYADPDQDLAMLKVAKSDSPAVTFGDYLLRGEEVFVYGMPGGLRWTYTEGYSMRGTDYSEIGDPYDDTWMISCGSCFEGDSGAATFNEQGEVVGMVVASMPEPPSCLIIPSQFIKKFLDQVK